MTGSIKSTKRRTVWERDVVCHYCGQIPSDHLRTVDHIWPRARGGSSANWNLVASCSECNTRRNDQTDKCACEFCATATSRHRFDLAATRERPVRPHPGISTASVADLTGWALVDDEWVPCGRRTA